MLAMSEDTMYIYALESIETKHLSYIEHYILEQYRTTVYNTNVLLTVKVKPLELEEIILLCTRLPEVSMGYHRYYQTLLSRASIRV